MNDIDGVVSRSDLVELVERAGGQPKRTGAEFRCSCVIHGGHNPSGFAIYNEAGRQHWKCFTREECGGGDVIDFVMKWQNITFLAAIEYLGGARQVDRVEMVRLAEERAERVKKELDAVTIKYQVALSELRQAHTWIRYHDQLDQHPELRQLWNARGIPDIWQDLWFLGYDPTFTVNTTSGLWTTPTLSIPIFAEGQPSEPINIRHRLLNPPTPTDKYRPDRPGLKAAPFICDPESQLDNVFVVEGEIKAMVSYITLDSVKWQVMGIPGKKIFRDLVPQLKGRQVVICLDPDALHEAEEMARLVGGRVVEITEKIDDCINDRQLNKDMLRKLIRTSRKVR